MEEKAIQVLIQGGAVGIACYALFVLNKLVGNHIDHSTEAAKDLTVAVNRLIQFLEDRIK